MNIAMGGRPCISAHVSCRPSSSPSFGPIGAATTDCIGLVGNSGSSSHGATDETAHTVETRIHAMDRSSQQ